MAKFSVSLLKLTLVLISSLLSRPWRVLKVPIRQTPGRTYERPTTEEALLTNRGEPGLELLRMGKVVKTNLNSRFSHLGLKKKGKKQPLSKPIAEMFLDDLSAPRTSPLGPSPTSPGPRFQSTNLHFHFEGLDQIPQLPMAAGQLILDCLNRES